MADFSKQVVELPFAWKNTFKIVGKEGDSDMKRDEFLGCMQG